MDIKHVLVPVDFSAPSRLALDYSMTLARRFRARLTLLNVVEAFWNVMYTSKADIAKIEKQQRAQALRMLSALVSPEEHRDLDYRVLIRAGLVGDEIDAAIREEGIDAVVMGTHSRNLIGRTLIGSVTEQMLRRVTVPVLTVCRASRPLTFDRILYAVDLGEASDQGFRAALDLARVMHAKLSVVHAVDDDANIDAAGAAVAQMIARDAPGETGIETLIREGNAVDAIFAAAETVQADMIVLAVRRKGFVERVVLGAAAERIVRESPLPVLSIPVGNDLASNGVEVR